MSLHGSRSNPQHPEWNLELTRKPYSRTIRPCQAPGFVARRKPKSQGKMKAMSWLGDWALETIRGNATRCAADDTIPRSVMKMVYLAGAGAACGRQHPHAGLHRPPGLPEGGGPHLRELRLAYGPGGAAGHAGLRAGRPRECPQVRPVFANPPSPPLPYLKEFLSCILLQAK